MANSGKQQRRAVHYAINSNDDHERSAASETGDEGEDEGGGEDEHPDAGNVPTTLIDDKTPKALEAMYYDPADAGSYGGIDRLLRRAKATGLGVSREQVQAFLTDQQTYSLHKPTRRTFKRNFTYVSGIDKQWQADLADMQLLSRYNKGNKYILTCIDVFSKYAWAIPVQSKSAVSMVAGFKELFKEAGQRKPKRLQTDQGKEFLCAPVQALLKQHGIVHFSSFSDQKAAVVERFNRTLRDRISAYQSKTNTKSYMKVLPRILKAYNASWHRSIKMAPRDVLPKHENKIWTRLYGDGSVGHSKRDRELAVGQKVRVPKWKGTFEKGYTPRWTEEHFTVRRALKHPQRVYELAEYDGDPVRGIYYEDELQPIGQNIYTVEKELAHRKHHGRKQVLVKWRGWPEKFNTWQYEDELQVQ
jgi:transposase InsO family protein